MKLKRVTLKDLAHERWTRAGISENWDSFVQMSLSAGNPPPRTGIRTETQALRDYLVATSDFLGYTARRSLKYAAPQFRFAEIRIKELERVRHVRVSYRKDGYLSPAGRRFIEILKASAKENAAKKP